MWSVVPLLRPSIHPRQVPMTQDSVPAARLDKHVRTGACVWARRRKSVRAGIRVLQV